MRSIGLILICIGGFILYLSAIGKVTPAMQALFTGVVPGTTASDGVPNSIFTDPKQDASIGGGIRA